MSFYPGSGLYGSRVLPSYPLTSSYIPTTYPLNYSIPAVAPAPVATVAPRPAIKGESRIEYVPYEKSVVEYEPETRTHYVPVEKKVTDYYQIEHQTEYIPQISYDRVTEYVPVERLQERVDYQAVERSVVHPPAPQPVATQPLVQSVAPAPVYHAPLRTSYAPTYYPSYAPLASSYLGGYGGYPGLYGSGLYGSRIW